ncbi:LOW QUALITY PROTEIN: Eukaryotic/viral aspartic protease [Phytophthora palmivora]|uniref:Eukaryotic/viral aspartic protease n=1 Tax=Phytophthora palmivora TaxID=4796 RepID=A0A2P4Y525_9STRA|nr:LOW QUALITY PROTEIN: Eukaryotic/viral aspartic protease [Phytophthora palmivora]
MFAFAGEVNWPEDREITSVTAMETEKERGASLSECGMKEWSTGESSGRKTEGSIVSTSRVERSPRSLIPRTKLLPGERLGWWSSQRYDKRKRMRALVKGAMNDVRTRILLDTGTNVSVISANYAKRLRLREVPDHGRSLEVRGINPGVDSSTSTREVHPGWERMYEFEMWIMNHSAGVDVVLGTDFMIPAGVLLDLFHGTARLPDEVMVPLIKSLSAADDEPYGTQVVGGPTEDLYIPGHEWREFRLKCKRPPRDTHEVLDPTDGETRPDGNEV